MRLKLDPNFYDQLPFAMCIVDAHFNIAHVNSSFLCQLCEPSAVHEGANLLTVFPEQSRVLSRKIKMAFTLDTVNYSSWQQRPFIFPMKSSRPISDSAEPMFQNVQFIPLRLVSAGDQRASHVCILITDATTEADHFLKQQDLKTKIENEHAELLKLHEELKRTQQQMIHSERMASVGQLADGIAHEINNPTGYIRSNLETLAEYTASLFQFIEVQEKLIARHASEVEREVQKRAYVKHNIDFIKTDALELITESIQGANRIKDIVKSLRDFAHFDAAEEAHRPVDLVVEIKSVVTLLENEIRRKALLELELDTTSAVVKGRVSAFRQLLLNVVMNALQAIEHRGNIKIQLWIVENHVVFSISDDGPGIPEDIKARIFEPFFTTKRVGEGTGLGLSEVYAIVREHKGHLEVKSEEGRGSSFIFQFPLSTAEVG